MSSKATNLKEKIRIALTSTAKVISEDFVVNDKNSKNEKSKNSSSIEVEALTSPADFIRLRAETDSAALKKNSLIIRFIEKTYHLLLHVDHFITLLKK